MSLLGKLLQSAWRKWAAADRPLDITQQVIALANSSRTQDAKTLAFNTPSLHWESIAETLPESSADIEPILDLCLFRSADRFPALLALGRWLAANRQPLRAYQCAWESHRLRPAEPSPLALMGWVQLGLGNPCAAGNEFLAAIRRDEHHKEAIRGYRLAWQRAPENLPPATRSTDAQATEYLKAIAAEPNDFRLHLALGKHLATSSQCALALPYLRTAHELAPLESESAYWLSWSLAALDDTRQALEVALAAYDNAPGHSGLLRLAAECAFKLGQEPQALAWLNQLVEHGDADAAIHAKRGDCLNRIERFEEATESLSRALRLDPAFAEARHNLAYSYHCLGRYAEAQEQLDFLLQSEKNDFSARWYRATCLLAAHRFQEGWRDYEFRFVSAAVEGRIIPLPAWRGEALTGKKIVVTAEQGIGDEIMFASCLPQLIAQAGHCVIECNRRLVDLFRRSFPQATVVEWLGTPIPPWMVSHGDADYHVFCGSLPLRFRRSQADFEQRQPYLTANQDQVGLFRQRLAKLGGGLKIGIAWRGGGSASRTKTRSLRLDQLLPVFDTPDCTFVSIQYGNHDEEVAAFNQQTGNTLHHWPEAIADLDAFAALLAALDIIVTVCSAPVHFAGALGKPALVLTPYAPEWRYRGIGGRMVWYPSVHLFPQARLDDWSGTIDAVAEVIRQKSREHAAD